MALASLRPSLSAVPKATAADTTTTDTSSTTTIFSFGPVLDQILATVSAIQTGQNGILAQVSAFEKIATSVATLLQNQQTILTNQGTLLTVLNGVVISLAGLSNQFQALVTDQVGNLGANVANITELLQVMVNGLSGLANEQNQQAELALLNQILNDVEPFRPVTIGLDLTQSATAKQPVPSTPGP